MVLRDIFIELENIFDFHYEKNKNGTYRVNTVISCFVYPELYTAKEFRTTDICYFLAHPEDSYQNYPNIRNSFSELMNAKEKSNRFPIIDFCNQIDILQMYQYYEVLIHQLSMQNTEKAQQLTNFIKRISENDPIFYARLKLICNKPPQFLTWIIIFSMFNSELANEKFEAFLKTDWSYVPELSMSESDIRHKLSTIIQKKRSHLSWMTFLLIILNSCLVIFSLSPYILPLELKQLEFLTLYGKYYIFLLFFSILILALWKYHTRLAKQCSDLQSLHDYMDLFPSTSIALSSILENPDIQITPFINESKSHMQRNKTRNILTPVTIGLCLLASIPSFIVNSFPFLLAAISALLLSELYVDLIIHNYRTRTFYDSLSEPAGEKCYPYRGLAKIYRWEYEKTGFDLKDEFYDNPVQIHSSTCYKHIFYIAYDRIKYRLFYRHSFFLYFNCIILILEALNLMVGDITSYLRLPDISYFNLFITIYLVALGIYNITTLITDISSYNSLSLLAYGSSHAEENPQEAERLFLSLRAKGIIHEADWVRGISTYNMALYESGQTAETIFPESDRMQYQHRTYQFQDLTFYTVTILYGILFMILVWHCGFYWLLLPLTALAFISYRILIRYYIGIHHKKRIVKEIQQLQYLS
jgi:hypothetical protein